MWEVVELWHILAWPCVGIHRGLDNRGGGREESRAGHESGSSTGTRKYTRGNTRG